MSPARKSPKRRQCGMMQVHERLCEQDPGFRGRLQRIEEQSSRYIQTGAAQRTWRKLVTIPVVVHVVYKTDEENISDEQIKSQIDVLNLDFRAKNPDTEKAPDVWKGLVADANVQFELAKKDPKGKATDGITRTHTTRDSFGTG